MVRKNAPKVEDSKPLLTDRKKDEAGGKVETVRRAKSAPLKNTGSKTTEKKEGARSNPVFTPPSQSTQSLSPEGKDLCMSVFGAIPSSTVKMRKF